MRHRKRTTVYILLFSFGFLFFKNLFPSSFTEDYDNCDEVGHIHIFHVHTENTAHSNTINSDSKQNSADCHEAKSASSYSHYPSQIYHIVNIPPVTAFDIVFKVDNTAPSPFLDPFKKPPRLA